jgi:hypothetical protein
MTHAIKTAQTLVTFNQWRRGDETIEMPAPEEIGRAIDDAVNLLRKYEAIRCALLASVVLEELSEP